jgi:murein DD-endopeptidase MepM/ murein hydrolase activator NlpD
LALQQTVVVREARLIAAAQGLARARAERLRMILRAAGVDPSAAGSGGKDDTGLIQGSQPGDLAGALGVDEDLARLIQQAARAAGQARDLGRASMGLPIGRPTPLPARPNDFGMRVDPFTGRLTFHPGLDFPAPRMTPVYATAEGVVTYAGLRNGYGATVEVDHGNGFFTRFAHLAAIVVKAGQRVEPHTQLGAVGSTGRSTGPHLHYEIWRNGRPRDPGPYLRVGDYVEAAG